MINISADQIESLWQYDAFIPLLENAFQSDIVVPQRNHYNYENGQGENNSTLLIMPAWSNKEYVGVKMVTVSPHNGDLGLPSIQGNYTLIEAKNGKIKAQIDAKKLTVKRTAATSALASKYLSKKDSKALLMIGTGALCPELIRAHCSVRPIEHVFIWGRAFTKAQQRAKELQSEKFEIRPIESLEQVAQSVDIISVATLSPRPLVFGKWLKSGQHIDLVGSYRPDMREADNECLLKSSLFIDSEGALKESGDLAIPISEKVIAKSDIKSTLFEMTKHQVYQRASDQEITLFKSVGHALEDLSAAIYLMKELRVE